MRGVPLIRAAAARQFAEFLAQVGTPVEHQWMRAGLSVRALAQPESFIPVHLVNGFLEHAAASQGIEDLGLQVARRSSLASLGTFGNAIRAATTLHQAVSTLSQLVSRHNSGARFWTVREGASVRLCRRIRSPDGNFRQMDLFTVAILVELLREVGGPEWRPSKIELQSGGRSEYADVEMFADVAIESGRATTSITFPHAFLSRRLKEQESSAAVGMSLRNEVWMNSHPPTDFIGSVSVVIRSLLEAEAAELVIAARAAGLSVRMFQRRLAELGANFSGLVDAVRSRAASELLDDASIKIGDIAEALGYSDRAHFTRAFRRWTSVTPLEYRQLRLAEREGTRQSA